jgi:hypothetical protein
MRRLPFVNPPPPLLDRGVPERPPIPEHDTSFNACGLPHDALGIEVVGLVESRLLDEQGCWANPLPLLQHADNHPQSYE